MGLSFSALAPAEQTLRSPRFDTLFVYGTAGASLLVLGLLMANPVIFPLLFLLHIWALGYHHVVATYTRLNLREHKFLLIGLPLILVAITGLITGLVGAWVVISIYYYWNSFHLVRQSYGVCKIYERKASDDAVINRRLNEAIIYLIPLWGVLYRSWQSPDSFLYMPMKFIPVPEWLVQAAGALAIGAILVWGWQQVRLYRQKRLPWLLTAYMLSHIAMFTVGFVVVKDINQGFIITNTWHTTQYLMIVWLFNHNRFSAGIDPAHPFISEISQGPRIGKYLAVCAGASTALYLLLYQFGSASIGTIVLPLTMICIMSLNFHHYVVDAIIWKVRKPAIRHQLGMEEQGASNAAA